MKKLINLITCLTLLCVTLFGFFACDDEQKTKEPKIKGELMTEQEAKAWLDGYESRAESEIAEGVV